MLKEGRYAELIELAETMGPLDPATMERRDTLVGHARLAITHEKVAEVAAARERERSSRWLSNETLIEHLARAVRDRGPFAFIRLGDREARFVITMNAELRPSLPVPEASAITRSNWAIWFGQRINHIDTNLLSDLMASYRRAV